MVNSLKIRAGKKEFQLLFLKLWTSFVTLWTNKKEKIQFIGEQCCRVADLDSYIRMRVMLMKHFDFKKILRKAQTD